MRSNWSPLAPTFRSQLQGRLLAAVLLSHKSEWSITELAARLDAPLTSVQSEVTRLVEGQILADRKVGRTRLVSAQGSNAAVAPLTQLVLVTFGPQVIIAEEFASVNAAQAFIFGSWADRYHGNSGAVPADIDVLLIGDAVDRAAAYDAAERAQARLGHPVNPVIRTRSAWANPDADPLLSEIARRPLVPLSWSAP